MNAETLRRFGYICLLLAVMLLAPLARGQNANSGEIKGTVTDTSGAVATEVAVKISNVQTGVVTATATNGSGIYDVPSVPLGEYTITFSKAGFRDFVHEKVVVNLSTIVVDVVLQVGVATERVVVTAETSLLQTETSDQTANFDNKAVMDTPIVGGRWFDEMTKVLPGVGGGGGRNASGGEGVAVNGTQSNTANFQIEGTSATDPRDLNASDNYVPIDAIGEISVSTANAGAQNGNSVLSLNVTMKSGTNRWHGSLFEFVQNDKFNARSYFQNTGTKAPVRWNEFGGSVGGPIIKNKLFFYFTYQRNPVGGGGFFRTTVPTDAMRAGDFSAASFPTVYNNASCAGACARTPLNGGSNVLLAGQIDPVAAAILKFIPVATDKTTNQNNFSAIVPTPSLGIWYTAKVDYQLSSSHRLSGSFFEYPITLIFNPDALCGLGFDCTKSTPNNRNQSARITETWTISPTVINEFRAGGLREHDQYAPPSWGKGFPTKIGLEPAYGAQAPIDVFPNISVSNSNQAGPGTFIGGGVHANLVENILNSSDVLTVIRGRHTLKLGGELDRLFQHDTSWGDSSTGDFTFNGLSTASGTSLDPRKGGIATTGIPFADFLLGDVGTWNIFNGTPTNIASWITGAFVNDDFKVKPRFTLNLGLRYQHQTGWAVGNNAFGNMVTTLPNPGSFPPGHLGAMQFGGSNGHNTIEPSVNSWSPRLGFAWSPRDKWSVRGSLGVFQVMQGTELYAHDNFPATLGFGFNPQGSIFPNSANFPTAFQLQTGPPAGSFKVPDLTTLGPGSFTFKQVAHYAPSIPLQYNTQFLLSVQREMPWGNLMDVSYVHTRGTNLNFANDMNQVPASHLAQGGDFSSFRPFPQYTSILDHSFAGWSNYNALQLRLVKRLSQGLSYQFNYSWSKLMDTGTSGGHDQGLDTWQIANNPRANYGLSQLDATHNLNGIVSYDVPFGQGRAHPLSGVLNQIIGGWRATAIIQARSGIPFTPIMANGNADLANSGSISCFCGYALRPNRIGTGVPSNQSLPKWADVGAFVAPPAFTFGNSGRNILRGPKFWNADMSMGKSFRIRESMNFEIRADVNNIFNHPNFGLPNSNILSTKTVNSVSVNNFGEITSVASGSRYMQLGARFSF